MLKRFFFFLTLVCIVCGAFYLSSPKKMVELEDPVWPVLNAKQVDRVDVCLLAQDCFSLVRRSDGWGVAQHGWNSTVEADKQKVDSLLGVLSQGKALRYLGSVAPEAAPEYGFQNPKVRITAGGGQELTMTVGTENPSGEGFFAMSSKKKDDLFLLSSDFVRQCEFPAHYFYKLFLLSGQPDNVASISLGSGGAFSWTLTRQDGIFRFSFPASLSGKAASAGEIDFLLHSLLEVPAKDLVSESARHSGNIILNVDLTFADKRVERLEIFEPLEEGDVYIARSTTQNGYFVVSREHFAQLSKKAFEVQQRNVVSVETGKLRSMKVVQGDQTFVGVKSDKNWINFEDKKPLLGIDMSLWRLNELKFEAEPVDSLSEFSEKVMELELMDENGAVVVMVSFFSDSELPTGQCWLSLGDGSGYYPVSDKLLEDLQGQIPLRK